MIEILITSAWDNEIRISFLIAVHKCKLVTTKSADRKKITKIFIIKGNIRDIIMLSHAIGKEGININCNKYTITPY